MDNNMDIKQRSTPNIYILRIILECIAIALVLLGFLVFFSARWYVNVYAGEPVGTRALFPALLHMPAMMWRSYLIGALVPTGACSVPVLILLLLRPSWTVKVRLFGKKAARIFPFSGWFSAAVTLALCAVMLICGRNTLAFWAQGVMAEREQARAGTATAWSGEGFDYSWTENPYVAHAFGGIEGQTYTNSLEAFLLNYGLGHRVFEVDFELTDDGVTVAAHDEAHWRRVADVPDESPFSYAEYKTRRLFGKYHGVPGDKLINIMRDYPDIYIVTDTKYIDKDLTEALLAQFVAAADGDPAILDRFIIQIYNEEMLDWVMGVYPWRSVIYTLYANPDWTRENVLAFSQRTGVRVITMWANWVTPEIVARWCPEGIQIAAHTVNDFAEAQTLRAEGVSVIYTDHLIP